MAKAPDGNRNPDHAQGTEAGGSPYPVRVGRRIALLLCGAFLLGVGMAAVVLWATSNYYGDIAISGAPLVAALLGGGGAMALGAGLMAALFYSDRSRWDERVR
jgi:hypothetical protein